MSLNPQYVTAPNLQEYFVDKDSGLPLAGGKIFFYSDVNRTTPKTVYELEGNGANYTYVPLPNPIILSAVGTVQDNDGNDVIIYYFPFDASGNEELYYIVVQNSLGVPQFTRSAWPNPNGSGGSVGGSFSPYNFIPNGQLLEHTNLANNAIVAGSNVLAQGGFTFEFTPAGSGTPSVNTSTFLVQNNNIEAPQSPRYLLNVACTVVNGLDTQKTLRVKWADVNKFSTPNSIYTFAFYATSNLGSVPVTINLIKYCGTNGSVVPPLALSTITIENNVDAPLYNINLTFGNNDGLNVDTVNNNDYVALEISFPTSMVYDIDFSDFLLVAQPEGSITTVTAFPVQTNEDMMTRGVMGWAETVDPNGMDLFLPPILTRAGMTWDASQVGTVGMSIMPILSPTSLPAPQHNMMPCDGSSYLTNGHASNGVPFSRLAAYLQNDGLANNLPLYGTGSNYVSCLYPLSGATNTTMRIVYNIAGGGSTQPADGLAPNATGFTFAPKYAYTGVFTGTASRGLQANIINNTSTLEGVCLNGNSLTNTLQDGAGVNATGFTIVRNDTATALRAFQTNSFTITTVTGAALVKAGSGRYFFIGINATQYYMWFNVDGANTLPAVGPNFQVNISSTYSAADVADCVREALSTFAASDITITGTPPITAGVSSYFTFYSNPASLRSFYVWYYISDLTVPGADPMPVGITTGIRVSILSTDTPQEIRNKTQFAINTYQFSAPDFRGMFFRAGDPNATWDLDAVNRWSYIANNFGNAPGTFEYQQFLAHNHTFTSLAQIAPNNAMEGGTPYLFQTQNTGTSGGTETRPVNATIYPFIRY